MNNSKGQAVRRKFRERSFQPSGDRLQFPTMGTFPCSDSEHAQAQSSAFSGRRPGPERDARHASLSPSDRTGTLRRLPQKSRPGRPAKASRGVTRQETERILATQRPPRHGKFHARNFGKKTPASGKRVHMEPFPHFRAFHCGKPPPTGNRRTRWKSRMKTR
jgi:hypothetical protein